MGRTENGDVAAWAERELGLARAALEGLLGKPRADALGVDGNRAELFPHRHGTDGFFFASFEKRR
jgi:16S rRNA (cytosine967-C5)-methyltransferase